MALYDDWQQYLVDPKKFDSDHFDRLLFEQGIWNKLEQLFLTLPGGKTIVSRLTRLIDEWHFNGVYLVAGSVETIEVQRKRAERYVAELANLGEDEGLVDDATALRNAPIIVSTDRAAFQEMSKDRNLVVSEIPDLLFDLEQEQMNKSDPRLCGAYESILGLTLRPDVTSWIMGESLSTQIDLEPAYELYRDGGKILLAHSGVQLLVTAAGE